MAAGNDGILVNPATIPPARPALLDRGGQVRRPPRIERRAGRWQLRRRLALVAGRRRFRTCRALDGDYEGNIVHLALAGPIAEKLYLGVAGKWLSLDANGKVSAATADWYSGRWVNGCRSARRSCNLVPISGDVVAPMGVGAGVTLGNDRVFQLTAEWRADLDRAEETSEPATASVRGHARQPRPTRAGWAKDETLDTSPGGRSARASSPVVASLDVRYRQSLDAPSTKTIAASLKMFLFD